MKNSEGINQTPQSESGPANWPIGIDIDSGQIVDVPFSNIVSLLDNNLDQLEARRHGNGVAVKRKSDGEVLFFTDTPKQMEFLLNYSLEK